MNPRLNKLTLTSHITFSVGWFGAVVVFLIFAIIGLNTHNEQQMRSAYLAMEMSAWFVIVPFALASLITGIIQAIGTKWGLLKHYWIAVKLFLTTFSTIILILHLKPIIYLARLANDNSISAIKQSGLQIQLIADAGAAILVLLAAITISIYKPWGKINISLFKKNTEKEMQENQIKPKKTLMFYINIAMILLVVAFIIMHLFGGGMGPHNH
jgi:hypothetical protein